MVISKDNLVINRESCPVCKSKNRTILFSASHNSPGFLDFIKLEEFFGKAFYEAYENGPLSELLYEIAECNNCHFIYLTEVLSDEGMGLLYNEWLDKDLLKVYYSNMDYEFSDYEETLLRVIKKYFRKTENINVMDFGAGYGNFCSTATKLGFKVCAFDLSTDKNDHINSMGVTIINNFDNYKGYFDFIYINQVFEHLSDPGGILKSLRESLNDSGLLYMAVPDTKDLKKVLKEEGLSYKLSRLLNPHQHINAFSNSSLKLLGINAGLKPLSMRDFLGMFNGSFDMADFKFLIKKVIKNSNYGTGLFFAPVVEGKGK